MTSSSLKEIIWLLVASVPPGSVATYGQIARLAGYPNHARYVGATLKKLPKDTALPWFRIIKGGGKIAFPLGSPPLQRQKSLLEAENVPVCVDKVDLKLYQWRPEGNGLLTGLEGRRSQVGLGGRRSQVGLGGRRS